MLFSLVPALVLGVLYCFVASSEATREKKYLASSIDAKVIGVQMVGLHSWTSVIVITDKDNVELKLNEVRFTGGTNRLVKIPGSAKYELR